MSAAKIVIIDPGHSPPSPERGRHADLLRIESERFAFATDSAQIGYWFCDLPFDKLFWDRRVKEHFWLPPEAEVDIGLFYARLHPDDRERTRQAIETSMATHSRYDIEYRTVSPDGRIKWINAIGRTAYDLANQPVRFDGVTLDITALKEAEHARDQAQEALLRSEKLALVGRLAATISHEINNPLEAVTNLLYLISSSATDDATRNYVRVAQEELARASHIVTHTLRFSQHTNSRAWANLSAILDSALAVFDGRLRHSGIHIRRDYTASDRLFCFPSELRQVAANLIGNSFDAMKQGGRLVIRTRNAADPHNGHSGIRVTIADSGTGMDADTQQRLFEPFFTTRGDKGTGLGLWVCREILTKHGAKIRVKSREGTGTVFSIWLPENRADAG